MTNWSGVSWAAQCLHRLLPKAIQSGNLFVIALEPKYHLGAGKGSMGITAGGEEGISADYRESAITQESVFMKAKRFWDSQSSLGKHLLGVLLWFVLMLVILVLWSLGLKNLGFYLMFPSEALGIWAFGLWYVFKAILRNIVVTL